MSAKTTEEINSFYLEEVCSRADDIFRLAFFLTLDPKSAHDCVNTAFENIAKELPNESIKDENVALKLADACFTAIGNLSESTTAQDSTLSKKLSNLDLDCRLSIAFIDLLGLSKNDAISILKWDEGRLNETLAKGRKALTNLEF